jgi:RNA polymerase sigma-70 factor (ECF subfamily)
MGAGRSGDDFVTVLRAAQLGEEWAFSVLYRRFNSQLVRYFASRAPDHAEDLAAESWMGAARTLSSFGGGEQAFRGWMFTIAHRRLVQHWRDVARRPQTEPAAEIDRGHTDPGGVEAEALDQLTGQQAARLIASSLTPEQAEVILLRILAGLDVDEVARIVGKRAGAVRSLQHKALRKLARQKIFLEALTP